MIRFSDPFFYAHVTGAKGALLGKTSWLDTKDQISYSEFISRDDDEINRTIRKATKTGRPFGSDIFFEKMELMLGQPLRPQKTWTTTEEIRGGKKAPKRRCNVQTA